MQFFYKNLAALYVAIVAMLMAWIYGGTMSQPLVHVVPWLMLFMAEIMFIFPQVHHGESTYDARARVWSAMRHDPLVLTAFGFILMLAIPFVNNGLCENCDQLLIATGVSPDPPIKQLLPFCVNRMDHLNVFFWFVTALTCMMATKHSLTNDGKRIMLELIAWNGAALATFGFIEVATGAPGPFWIGLPNGDAMKDYFSTWGYANIAGDYFVTLFCISFGLWRWHCQDVGDQLQGASGQKRIKARDRFWKKHIFLIPTGLCFVAALNTLSRSAILMSTVLFVLFFLHTFISFTHKFSKARRVKAIAIWGFLFGLAGAIALLCMPAKMKKEVNTIGTTEVLQRVTGKNENHVKFAKEMWLENPLFGCGGWGYRHFYLSKTTPEEVAKMKKYEWARVGKANVHNDYMQFLAEHGLIGLIAFVALIVMLLFPIYRKWKRLVKMARFSKKDRPPRPTQIFVIPAPVFCMLGAIIATIIHGFADCPFRSASVMTLFFIVLAALDGFMPRFDADEEEEEEGEEPHRHHHHHHHHHHESK